MKLKVRSWKGTQVPGGFYHYYHRGNQHNVLGLGAESDCERRFARRGSATMGNRGHWVRHTGFQKYAACFRQTMSDPDRFP